MLLRLLFWWIRKKSYLKDLERVMLIPSCSLWVKMIRVKYRGMEFRCDTPREATQLERMLRLEPNASPTGDFDVLYIPGGKRPPAIIDGYDFIMAIRPLQGRELDSVTLAKRLRLKGTQGLGPFFARMDKAVRRLTPPVPSLSVEG